MAKKNKKDKSEKKSKKKGNSKGSLHLMLVGIVLLSAVFLSTAVVLYIGLIPMFVAFYTDSSKGKGKAVTVGAFNFMGCVPYVFELWSTAPTLNKGLSVILDPMTLVIIYGCAAFGYLVDWVATNVASQILHRKGVLRQDAIRKRQERLVKRWGENVRE